jgi:flavorubredoxin
MKRAVEIFSEGDHRWVALTRDPEKLGYVIDTNEYLVSSGGQGLLTDPGGMEIFPAVFSALSGALDLNQLKYLFASHQDPDVISSLALWLEYRPDLRCYVSWLWSTFIPHYGGDDQTLISLPDEGATLELGAVSLEALPAHHLHSAGNFHLYDPAAKLLFSGDVGAAMLAPDADLYVRDFDAHIRHAEGFHRRWMGSREAKRSWCERVAALQIDQLCPQHGAIYRGRDVERFIHWFDELEVGVTRPPRELGRRRERAAPFAERAASEHGGLLR